MWTNLEGHIGLWCCCFPALSPLLRKAAQRLGLTKSGSSANASNRRYHTDGSLAHSVNRGTANRSNWGKSLQNLTAGIRNGYMKSGAGNDADNDSSRCFVDSTRMEMASNDGTDDVEMKGIAHLELGVEKGKLREMSR